MPSWRVPWSAARRATLAARAMREVGIRSFAIALDGVRAPASGSPRAARRRARGGLRGRRRGRRRAPASAWGPPSRVGVGVGVAPGVRVASGVAFSFCFSSSEPLPPPLRSRLPKNVVGLLVPPDLLAGEQLGGGDEGHGEHERERAGGERDLPLARREPEAARRLDGALRRRLRQRLEVLGRRRGERVEGPRGRDSRPAVRRELATLFTVSVGRFRPSRDDGDDDRRHRRGEHRPRLPEERDDEGGGRARGAGDQERVEGEAGLGRGSARTPLHASEMALGPGRGTCDGGGSGG